MEVWVKNAADGLPTKICIRNDWHPQRGLNSDCKLVDVSGGHTITEDEFWQLHYHEDATADAVLKNQHYKIQNCATKKYLNIKPAKDSGSIPILETV